MTSLFHAIPSSKLYNQQQIITILTITAHPYQRAIFDLREFKKKKQSHIVPNQNFQMHEITTDSKFKDAFEHCFEHFVDFLSLLKKNYF